MGNTLRIGRRWRARIVSGLAVPLLWPCLARAQTTEVSATEIQPAAQATQPQAPTLTLAECLRIAQERQPAITASQASLAAAETQRRGLEKLHAPPIFAGRERP